MAKTDFKSVDEYIAAQPKAVQASLRRVRSILRKALPGAEEVISYQIPAYKRDGATVIYFAGWKEHYSLYPVTARLIAALEADLEPYELSHKGTVRFPLAGPIPVRVIERVVKFRAKEAAEGAKAKGRAVGGRRKPARSKAGTKAGAEAGAKARAKADTRAKQVSKKKRSEPR